MNRLFDDLVFNAHSQRWNPDELGHLSLLELQTLAKLLGAPHSGTKEQLITKLLAIRTIRLKLSNFRPKPDLLAAAFKKRELRAMCKEAGLWKSGNKLQLAATILSWRERCRQKGQNILEEIIQLTRLQQKQLSLPLR